MCFMSMPKIATPVTPTPAPLPPPIDDAPKVDSIDFGGGAETDSEKASGVKGEKSSGKSSLKITKKKKLKEDTKKTGVNYNFK